MTERLILDEQFPISVSYAFSNKFTELANGDNQAIVEWEQPKAEFDVSKAFFDEEIKDYLIDFFALVSGDIFLYLDPCDNFCNDFEYEPKPGIFTVGELFPISETEFQLCKVYRAGGENAIRPISRPINDDLFAINTTNSHTVNFSTGRVVFSSPPTVLPIKWQGRFLIPCHLLEESLTCQIQSNTIDYSIGGLRFREIREVERSFYLPSSRPQSISAELDLDLIVGSQITTTKKISPMQADSGWYKESKLWEKPKTSYVTAEKTISSAEDVEAAIALWRVSVGGGIGFKYQEKTVRSKESLLSFTVEADFNFGISSLNLIESGDSSFLDNLDGQSYLVPIVDSSGSMNSDIPNVVEAINQLRPLVKNSVYRGSQQLTDKYFKPIQYLGDERWVDWLARDYRDDSSEPDKVVILAWINESNPVYHGGSNNSPTSQYQIDIARFVNSHSQREKFAAVIYAVQFASTQFVSFQNHLIAAYEGTNGYNPPLKEKSVTIRPDLLANTPAEFYLQDLFFGEAGFSNSSNFLCRCWSIEKVSPQVKKQDYKSLLISPSIPQQLEPEFSAYAYGTYISTQQEGIFNRGCGDLGYWRGYIPTTGNAQRNIYEYNNYFIISGGSRTKIIPISNEQYANKTTESLILTRALHIGNGCTSGGSPNNPFGKDAVITDVIPLASEVPPPPRQNNAYFELGQCDNVAYGFKAKYGAGIQTIVSGSVSGKITAVRVYLTQEASKWVYTLSVDDDNGNTVESILLKKADNTSLSLGDAPAGIYHIEAIRLDGQPDTCGNIDGSNNLQPSALSPQPYNIGFTNHDCIVSFEGINFMPQYGGNAQARTHTEDISSSNNTQTKFIFSSEAISRQDLLDGRYDGARFTEWIVNWDNPENRLRLASGYLGRTTTYHNNQGGLDFQVEMRSLLARLQQKNYFLTVKLCPKTFGKQGNGNCRQNLFGYIDSLEIIEVIDAVTFRINSNRTIDNFYGELTFTSGNRANVTKLIDRYQGSTGKVTLRSSTEGLSVGDKLDAKAKCDKSLKACMDFGNTSNFGGFWHVPGVDKARRRDR